MRTSLTVLLLTTCMLGGCREHKPKDAPPPPKPGSAAPAPAPRQAAAPAPAFLGKADLLARAGVSLSDVAERAVRSVVNISSTTVVKRQTGTPWHSNPFRRFFGAPPTERYARSRGSGVIVSPNGVVLTNNHVIKSAGQIKVVLHDGRELSAALVGRDEKSDLAVLRLKLGPDQKLSAMEMGDSSRLRLGQVVLAIGNPFGVGQTVTMGIVSAVGRANMGIVDYEDFIQTDAAINPGNSGGALVDLSGKLVGINTAILSRSGGYQGIGFAIPTRMAGPIMASLIQHGRVVRGWLGVVIQDLSREAARELGVPTARGVRVEQVQAGTPAARAGLAPGDVITALDGEQMTSVSRLRNRVAAARPGTAVSLTLLRKKKELSLTATLGELGGPPVARVEDPKEALAGLTVETLDRALREPLGLSARSAGVVVTRVEWGSPAAVAGLQEGDLIVEVERKEVKTAGEFYRRYTRATGKVLLLVHRKGSAMYLLVER